MVLQERTAEKAVADYKQKAVEEAERNSRETAEYLYRSDWSKDKTNDTRIQLISEAVRKPVEVVKVWLADLLVEPIKM